MSYQLAMSLMDQGRANPSNYQVVLPQRVLQHQSSADLQDYVSFFTRNVIIPSSSNQMMSLLGQENIGVQRYAITGRSFGSPLILTFSERSDMLIYNSMKGWLDSTVTNSEQTGDRHMRVQYFDDIKCDIQIHKLEQMDEASSLLPRGRANHVITGTWTMINCIPMAIEQSSMGMESADSMLDYTMSVQFESFKWEPSKPTAASVLTNTSTFALNALSDVFSDRSVN